MCSSKIATMTNPPPFELILTDYLAEALQDCSDFEDSFALSDDLPRVVEEEDCSNNPKGYHRRLLSKVEHRWDHDLISTLTDGSTIPTTSTHSNCIVPRRRESVTSTTNSNCQAPKRRESVTTSTTSSSILSNCQVPRRRESGTAESSSSSFANCKVPCRTASTASSTACLTVPPVAPFPTTTSPMDAPMQVPQRQSTAGSGTKTPLRMPLRKNTNYELQVESAHEQSITAPPPCRPVRRAKTIGEEDNTNPKSHNNRRVSRQDRIRHSVSANNVSTLGSRCLADMPALRPNRSEESRLAISRLSDSNLRKLPREGSVRRGSPSGLSAASVSPKGNAEWVSTRNSNGGNSNSNSKLAAAKALGLSQKIVKPTHSRQMSKMEDTPEEYPAFVGMRKSSTGGNPERKIRRFSLLLKEEPPLVVRQDSIDSGSAAAEDSTTMTSVRRFSLSLQGEQHQRPEQEGPIDTTRQTSMSSSSNSGHRCEVRRVSFNLKGSVRAALPSAESKQGHNDHTVIPKGDVAMDILRRTGSSEYELNDDKSNHNRVAAERRRSSSSSRRHSLLLSQVEHLVLQALAENDPEAFQLATELQEQGHQLCLTLTGSGLQIEDCIAASTNAAATPTTDATPGSNQ